MLRKLQKKYRRGGLEINFSKTEEEVRNLEINEAHTFLRYTNFKNKQKWTSKTDHQ